MTIVLGRPRLQGSAVCVDVRAGGARRYLRSGTVWADYGDLDLSGVDPAVLVLPALGAVLPVAYAAGVAVRTETVDAEYAASAEDLAYTWSTIHRTFAPPDTFALAGERVRAPASATGQPSGPGSPALLLYSGGLDSSASLLSHRDDVRVLLSAWFGDLPLAQDARWQTVARAIEASPATAGRRRVTVRTNLRQMTRDLRLSRERLPRGLPWWAAAHHGMALLSLAAPVTAALDLRRTYVAASDHTGSTAPWGSTPFADELLRWAGTHVVHDGYEMARQDKIVRLIAPQVRGEGHVLAVCSTVGASGRANCGSCEKCVRTALGLMLAGVAPADAGIDVGPQALDRWRHRVLSGFYTAKPLSLCDWRDLQRTLAAGTVDVPPPLRDFCGWLAAVEFDAIPGAPFWSPSRRRAELRRWRARITETLPQPAPGPPQAHPDPPGGARPPAAGGRQRGAAAQTTR